MAEPFCGRYKGRLGQIHEGRALFPRSALRGRASEICPKRHHHYGPLIFRLYNAKSGRTSHCAAQSFTAKEGTIVLPKWMLENLEASVNDEIIVDRACLPYATFCKFETYERDINDIQDRKSALQNHLIKLCCLTMGDVITVKSNSGATFKVNVVRTEPRDAVNITACDINAFVAELRYYEKQTKSSMLLQELASHSTLGKGSYRINYKLGTKFEKTDENTSKKESVEEIFVKTGEPIDKVGAKPSQVRGIENKTEDFAQVNKPQTDSKNVNKLENDLDEIRDSVENVQLQASNAHFKEKKYSNNIMGFVENNQPEDDKAQFEEKKYSDNIIGFMEHNQPHTEKRVEIKNNMNDVIED